MTETSFAAWIGDPGVLWQMRDRVFAPSWQPVCADVDTDVSPAAIPFTLLEGFLDEPLVITHDGESVRCLSNVCTHRGMLVARTPGPCSALRCGYHGRRFALDGRAIAAPGFETDAGFPREGDHLREVPLRWLGPLPMVSLAREPQAFDRLVAPIHARIDAAQLQRLRPDPSGTRAYEVAASWVLYCENYLEGLHIPFVHPELVRTLDWTAYETVLFDGGSLQIGIADDGHDAFASPDGGRRIAAYYFFLFPNVMLNIYPWGLSLNVVVPLAVDRTRVLYRTWRWDDHRVRPGAGDDLHAVEMQDEAVIAEVQRGVGARLFRPGALSPTHERAVEQFRGMLSRALDDDRTPCG